MTTTDPRSEKIAVVPEARFAELLPQLRDAGYGLMQLPPSDLAAEVAGAWIAQMVEQLAEYRRNDYEVVLAARGAWCDDLGVALERAGIAPLQLL